MPVDFPPPQPPGMEEPAANVSRTEAPIVDMRDQFARKTPQTAEDQARARDFIDGKIEMVRGDPNLTEAEKAAAIAELEAKRAEVEAKR
jgi:hypothetical protein